MKPEMSRLPEQSLDLLSSGEGHSETPLCPPHKSSLDWIQYGRLIKIVQWFRK